MKILNYICFFSITVMLLSGNFLSSLSAAESSSNEHTHLDYFEQYASEAVYLDLLKIKDAVVTESIIGKPPLCDSVEAHADKVAAEQASASATREEKLKAIKPENNNVFVFASILGSNFSSDKLPKTATFFRTISEDASLATEAAKNTFAYPRPEHATGYSYPSAYATRAFLWAKLLGKVFPNYKNDLYAKAEEIAQGRIILNRQYPTGISAGKIYGKYLANEFYKNPQFKKDWSVIKAEIRALIPTGGKSHTN